MGAPGLALETWETTSGYYYPSAQYGCWSYDSFGNRTQELFSSQPVNCAQSPQIVYNANNQAPSSLQYDQAGDVTGDSNSGNSYAYDGEGRICAVGVNISGPTSYTQYVYDAEGVRVAKGSAAGLSCSLSSGFTPSSLYLLGLGGEQVTELSVAGGLATPAHSNVFWGGKLLATYDLPNGGFHIALTDPLGTKRVQVSGTGRSELNCLSLPYGNDLGNPRIVNCYTPTYGAAAPDATEHHFTGKERDAESGNDYFGARYFGSSMGRFMSPDWSDDPDPVPFGDLENPQSLNLYAFAGNNPLSAVDEDGHDYYLQGGSQCGQNGVSCDNGGYVLGSDGNRQVVTDAQTQNGGATLSQGANGGVNVTIGTGTFAGQFFDASPDAVSATVSADPSIAPSASAFIDQTNAYNQGAMPVLQAQAYMLDLVGAVVAFGPHLAVTAGCLAANCSNSKGGAAQAAVGGLRRKPGTLGQHGSTAAENKIAKAIAKQTGASREEVHMLLQEASQGEGRAMTFSEGLQYVRSALGLLE
jgi:RHS repeat-associated protein